MGREYICSIFNNSMLKLNDWQMNVEQANTTITANSNRFNLSMPFGTNQFVQANISVIDCVGNRNTESVNFTRDLSTPEISIIGIESSLVSPSSLLSVNVTHAYALTSIQVNLTSGNQSVRVCSTSCEIIVWQHLNLSHNQTATLTVFVSSNSGHEVIQTANFVYDSEVSVPVIDLGRSENLTQSHMGPNSKIAFRADEFMSEVCVYIIGLSGSMCQENGTIFMFAITGPTSSQNITMVVNSTDLVGNTATSTNNLRYHLEPPSLNKTTYHMSSQGYLYLDLVSEVGYEIEIGAPFLQNSSNGSIYFSMEGINIVNGTWTDRLGNSRLESFYVVLDTTEPQINILNTSAGYMGRNSMITADVNELHSNITGVVVTILGQNSSCRYSMSAQSINVTFSVNISTVLGTPGCTMSQAENYPISIMIEAQNSVRRWARSTINTTFVGAHAEGFLSGTFFLHNSTHILVSNYSVFKCQTNHSIQTNLTQTVYFGNATQGAFDLISWHSGNGIYHCAYEDELGNTWAKAWTVSFIHNTISLNVSYANNSGTISKHMHTNLRYESTALESIERVEIHLNGSVYRTFYVSGSDVVLNVSQGCTSLDYRKNRLELFQISIWRDFH